MDNSKIRFFYMFDHRYQPSKGRPQRMVTIARTWADKEAGKLQYSYAMNTPYLSYGDGYFWVVDVPNKKIGKEIAKARLLKKPREILSSPRKELTDILTDIINNEDVFPKHLIIIAKENLSKLNS